MKATIEYDLDDESDSIRYARAMRADEMAQALFEISERLRYIEKYDAPEGEAADIIRLVRGDFYDITGSLLEVVE